MQWFEVALQGPHTTIPMQPIFIQLLEVLKRTRDEASRGKDSCKVTKVILHMEGTREIGVSYTTVMGTQKFQPATTG